jgi:meso-butanediol dehydrogenase/(S,S)-butanediol dehydrogenase/diacetyl reductase
MPSEPESAARPRSATPVLRLDGRVALVTGAASGIGRAVARAFADEGATVVAIDRDREGLGALEHSDDRVEAAAADVTSADEVGAVVAAARERHGRIDILANVAGVSTMARVVDLSEADWDFVMDVNAKGVFLMTRAVLPSMIERRSGAVVNVASAAGRHGAPYLAHYSASKFAVIGFTQSVALEVAALGIRVNSICPGLITTPMQEREVAWTVALTGAPEDAVRAGYVKSVPMGRLGTPEDVAKVAVFLASDEAGYLTGGAIDVGGGLVMT